MFGGLFGKKSTTKADVAMALVAAVFGIWKAFDTVKEYKEENS